MADIKQIHSGHRQRMKSKFLEHGLSVFQNHEILELLLYYVISQKDTNPLAHELINTFGSLDGVFDAPYEELLKIKGIGENCATLIKLIPQLAKKYYEASVGTKQRIYDTNIAIEILSPKFIGEKEEILVVLLLGSDGRALLCKQINKGSIHEVPVYIRTITNMVLNYNANSIILAHNHPSGNAIPSANDIEVTKEIYKTLNGVEVTLEDHVIFAKEKYCSMKKSGWLEMIRSELENGNDDFLNEIPSNSNAADN